MTLSNNPTSLGLFFFHPILQSLSIAVFTYGTSMLPVRRMHLAPTYADSGGLGILTLQPTSQAKTKAAGLTRHQLAMVALGGPAILLGTLAIVWRKSLHEHPHFTTWHGVSQIAAGEVSPEIVRTPHCPHTHVGPSI